MCYKIGSNFVQPHKRKGKKRRKGRKKLEEREDRGEGKNKNKGEKGARKNVEREGSKEE